jgi:hypothetical protein
LKYRLKQHNNNNNNNNKQLEPFQNNSDIPQQHTRKARNIGTANDSHIGHCTQTAGSADVKVQNIFNMRNNITCSADCKYRTAATLYKVVTWFVLGI